MGEEFYTFHEYMKNDSTLLSASGEDYMEMIYRLSQNNGFTRVNDLAQALNVQPPSVTKMVRKLADLKYIHYEKYGVIMLNQSGLEVGRALLARHNIIEEFLRLLDVKEGLLEETEKIEHTVNKEVLLGINRMVQFFKNNPDVLDRYKNTKDYII